LSVEVLITQTGAVAQYPYDQVSHLYS